MPNNLFITGAPGVGKTTVIRKVAEALRREGFQVGGVYCPQITESGKRVGFYIVDMVTGRQEVLAHKHYEAGPTIGGYRVQIDQIDAMANEAFPVAFRKADALMVDEIAPMEMFSETFTRYVREVLDMPIPVLAVIHQKSGKGFIGEVKKRGDAEFFQITLEYREIKVVEIVEELKKYLNA